MAKDEKYRTSLEPKLIFTPDFQQQIVDYAVNMGIKIVDAKTHEKMQHLVCDLASKNRTLKCFNVPPGVKLLKVFVKRNTDESPFYVFKATPSKCIHFFNKTTPNFNTCLGLMHEEQSMKNCPDEIKIEFKADQSFISSYCEYGIPCGEHIILP